MNGCSVVFRTMLWCAMAARKMTTVRIAKRHNENVKRRAEEASTADEEVIRRIEDAVEDNYSRATQESMEFNQKLLAIAHANADAYFERAREVVRATSPADFIAISTNCAQKQCQKLGQQARELVALGQKAAIENMGPLGTIVGGALLGRPDLS
jgi:hypothetical protein